MLGLERSYFEIVVGGHHITGATHAMHEAILLMEDAAIMRRDTNECWPLYTFTARQ